MSNLLPDHAWIAARIPHAGAMCLLDRVTEWNDTHIVCVAHIAPAGVHPLAGHRGTGVTIGIEYAAQAMAVHGALLSAADDSPRPAAGMLTSVRDVRWHAATIDAGGPELHIRAVRLFADAFNVMYAFEVFAQQQTLLCGRATVILRVDATPHHPLPTSP